MTTADRQKLFQTLVDMSKYYPELRFGQLVEFMVRLGAKDRDVPLAEVEDGTVLESCEEHAEKQFASLGGMRNGTQTVLPAGRQELLSALEDLVQRHPDWRFGQLVVNVADWADANVYDAEDEQLAEAARRHLGEHVIDELWGGDSPRLSQVGELTRNWSEWKDIGEASEGSGAVVYQVRLFKAGRPVAIGRFLGSDQEGILVVGETTSMERRRKQFVNGAAQCGGHSEANMLHYLNEHSPLPKVIPEAKYQYRYAALQSESDAFLAENMLIKEYVKCFGEPPPLNSVVPDRYGEKYSWCN